MTFKMYHVTFFFTLVSGTLISVSANSWFTSWLGLEVNLLSMIPLLLLKKEQKMNEASIKYFLAQAMASIMLIVGLFSGFYSNNNMLMELNEMLIMFALLMKAGLPPVHFWFPDLIHKINWYQCLIILTWQKVAPLLLLSFLNMNKIIFFAMLAAVVGCLAGLNQMNIKILMAYSSIAHSSWILISSLLSFISWSSYFLIYTVLSTCLILILSATHMNQISLNNLNKESFITKFSIVFNMMSLAGLPPFLGFMAKISILSYLLSMKLMIISMLLLSTSLISLYFYFRLSYSIMMINNFNKKKIHSNNSKNSLIILVISSFMNMFIPILNSGL